MIVTGAVGRGWVMSATMVPTKIASMCMPSGATSAAPSASKASGTGRNQITVVTRIGSATLTTVAVSTRRPAVADSWGSPSASTSLVTSILHLVR